MTFDRTLHVIIFQWAHNGRISEPTLENRRGGAELAFVVLVIGEEGRYTCTIKYKSAWKLRLSTSPGRKRTAEVPLRYCFARIQVVCELYRTVRL